MVKKSYTIGCGNRCPEILEKISEEIPGIYSATIEGSVIRIIFDESYMGVREAIELIKEIVRNSGLWGSRGAGSLARVGVRHIQRMIGGPVHIEPLIDLLRLRGYRASSSTNYIETDASVEEVIDLAMAISRCASETPKDLLTPRARKIIIILCADSDASFEHVMEFLKNKELVIRGPDGKLDIPKPLNEIKDIL